MSFLSTCGDIAPIIKLIKFGVLPLLYVAIGIIIVVLVIIDIAKAVIASDEKEVKGYQKAAIRRVIYGVIIFFVVVIVNAVFNLLTVAEGDDVSEATWHECWSQTCRNGETWSDTENKCVKK